MKLFFVPVSIAVLALLNSCMNKETQATELSASNPFYAASTLPYQAPAFDKIKDSDYKPAFDQGFKDQLAEIQAIADNTAAPTFDNTLVALEKSGQLLSRVNGAFSAVSGANTDSTLQKLQEEVAPKQAALQDAIYLNPKLFARVKAIYESRAEAKLDPEANRLVEYYYQQFLLAGAQLADADKAKLKKLNEEEAALGAKFSNMLLAAAKAGTIVVEDRKELRGLSDAEVDNLAQHGKDNKPTGKWEIKLQNTTQQPLLKSLANRDLRKKIFEASWNRAEKSDSNDTRTTILKIAKIRAEKAKLLGYPSYAAWKLQDQMAKNPEAVDKFFAQLVPAATAKAKADAAALQAVIDKQKGGFKLEAWDWAYYAEQLHKEKYNLDENEVKPYFEINTVLQSGVFYAANQLYGISFKERHDLPVYQKDVRVFEVFDKDSSTIGLYYCDYFKRDNKNGGAWMSNMVGQTKLLGTKPVIYNVFNFAKPADGQPALISFDDVTTMFHEFGHGLHGLFADQQYPTLSGTNTARDFVEFPSQFNENWATDPRIFKHYAVHYKTGAVMPQALVEKIKKAAGFNSAYRLTELLAAASLDLQWHAVSDTNQLKDVDAFQTAALEHTHLNLPQVPTRYRSSYFLHIWGNGYAAGYYAYLWTQMLDHDAFAWFETNGGLTRTNGQRFRDRILSRGNTEDYGTMFRIFTGHDPDIKPMLKYQGLQ